MRYDHASSSYPSTTVGPNKFVPIQANGDNFYTIPEWDGVKYNDITPRWGVAWDIFGTGKTSLKYNGGKYLVAANIGGIYSTANPARRTVNTLERNWIDSDVDRVVDCDVMNFSPNGECGTFTFFFPDTMRFGRDPFGVAPVNLATTQCGRQNTGEPGIPDDVRGVLRHVWRQPARRVGSAPERVAAWSRHSARDPAAPLGRVHVEPPLVPQPDLDRQAGHRLRPLQRDAGREDVPGELPELHQRDG